MSTLVLAQHVYGRGEQLQYMRRGFTEVESSIGTKIAMILGLLACLVALAYVLHRWQQRRMRGPEPHPMRLFCRLQRGLRLPWLDQWRLWWLARVLLLEHPAALLVSDALYDEAVRRYCSTPGWLRDRHRSEPRFAAIRRRLFTDDPPETDDPPQT